MPFTPPRVTVAELRPLLFLRLKNHMGPICFSKIMFTDSHNVDDLTVEPHAVFEIREAAIQPFHVLESFRFASHRNSAQMCRSASHLIWGSA
jgi:hypothetical protein